MTNSLCSHFQATYDPATREFVINTPTNEASKYWIGGTGQHGKICAVFAQLTVAGQWQVCVVCLVGVGCWLFGLLACVPRGLWLVVMLAG